MTYTTQAPNSLSQYGAVPHPVEEDRDPRENGSLIAQLQVAAETVAQLRHRLTNLSNRMFQENGNAERGKAPQHMSLMQFPSDIIADARCANSQINRIEGALGL